MAGGRTKDHRKTSAKTKRNSSEQCHKDTVRLSSSQLTWPFSDSKTNAVYRELDVAELHWPAEDERELSQEIVRVNPLNRHSILQVPSHKYVLSHWGRTSSLVASDIVANNGTRKGSSIKSGCTECTVNDTDSKNYWMSLSDEIILGIFKLLPKKSIVKCAQVCKHWQRLAYDESLWRCVDMTRVKNLPSGVLEKVIKRGTRVLRLALAEVDSTVCDNNASFFSDVVPLSPQSPSESMFSLRYLDASSCCFQGDTLLCILLHSKQLTHISLESCTISTSVLRAMSDFRHLEVLNLAMCHGLTANGVCSLAKSCSRLKQLNLAWTNLSKATILHVIKHLTGLQQLNISGQRTTVNDESIQMLVRSCPSLTNLDLSDCVLITARSLHEICKLENLVHLNLSRCYNVAPVAFSHFTEMKSLKQLCIFGLLNVEGLEVLKKELPDIVVNNSLFSSIARPVGSVYQGKIWGAKCRG